MTEQIPVNQEQKNLHEGELIEKGQESTVKNSWFRSWIEGNGLLPQTGLGILICMENEIMRDEQFDWESFAHSRLSEEQLAAVGKYMSGMHAARDIKVSTKEHEHLFQKSQDAHEEDAQAPPLHIVSDRVLQRLWRDIANTSEKITRLLAQRGGATFRPDYSDKKKFEALQTFWKAEEYDTYRNHMRNVFKVMHDALTSSEGKNLAKRYKDALRPNKEGMRPKSSVVWAQYEPHFRVLIEKQIEPLPSEERQIAIFFIKQLNNI